MTDSLNPLHYLIEESLMYRGLLFLWRFFTAALEGSLAVGLCRKTCRLLQSWGRDSMAVELLWRREYFSLWQGSLFRTQLGYGAALLHRGAGAFRELWETSRGGSVAVALYSRGKSSLESAPVTMFLYLLLAFVAVSMLLRLAVRLVQPLYLLAGAVSLVLLAVLLLHAPRVEQAWPESYCRRLALWLFSLDPAEKRRL